ncbi:hypothetical protein L218DRAFT_939675 [Marasmius fiardii PR-910]|nr:hypothetical protein L218DRAFT_939675 [Marasmius fiardii PR-910]
MATLARWAPFFFFGRFTLLTLTLALLDMVYIVVALKSLLDDPQTCQDLLVILSRTFRHTRDEDARAPTLSVYEPSAGYTINEVGTSTLFHTNFKIQSSRTASGWVKTGATLCERIISANRRLAGGANSLSTIFCIGAILSLGPQEWADHYQLW